MVRLSVISSAPIGREFLDGLRKYASVAEDIHDSLLSSLAKRAAFEVQEYADESVLACTFRLFLTGNTGRDIRLYQSVTEIESVRDGEGTDIPFSLSGRTINLGRDADSVDIIYRTEPEPGNLERLLPVVYRYATALYDGQDNIELTKILQEIC